MANLMLPLLLQMSISVQQITEPVILGEGPHWDDRHQALFFLSIEEKTIHKYVLATGEHTKTTLDDKPGFIVPVDGTLDQYIIGLERKFLVIQWDGKEGSEVQIVKELGEVDVPETRFNDGKADPRGRLFTGTMGNGAPPDNFELEKGSMYRLDSRGIANLGDGISLANGLAWDLEEKAFYYVDSLEYKIRRYDYDVETGEISNKTYAFDLVENDLPGFADGMTIDTDGNLWFALFGGSRVVKVDPRSGSILQEVSIPAEQVTSVTFGGPNMDILFVTTGNYNVGEELGPLSGATFMVTGLGVKGYPNVNFKLP